MCHLHLRLLSEIWGPQCQNIYVGVTRVDHLVSADISMESALKWQPTS